MLKKSLLAAGLVMAFAVPALAEGFLVGRPQRVPDLVIGLGDAGYEWKQEPVTLETGKGYRMVETQQEDRRSNTRVTWTPTDPAPSTRSARFVQSTASPPSNASIVQSTSMTDFVTDADKERLEQARQRRKDRQNKAKKKEEPKHLRIDL